MKIKCIICNKYIYKKGFSSHIRIHNLSSKEYYDKYIKNKYDGFCLNCRKKNKFYKIVKRLF